MKEYVKVDNDTAMDRAEGLVGIGCVACKTTEMEFLQKWQKQKLWGLG